MDYRCEVVNYNDLPDRIKKIDLPNNGSGRECASYLLVWYKGNLLNFYSDAMEPEDVTFHRDLGWVGQALEDAYRLGATG